MQIVHDYRRLHQIPEPDRNLPKTLSYICSVLKLQKCRVFSPVKGAICGYFDFGRPTTIAFRADMDALPIQENTDFPWRSKHPGFMHACGHDGHTAILLELARRLHREENLECNVLLIFQPAEETDGGARDVCQSGVLQAYKVKEIYGLHLWPGLKKGELFSRPGVVMSNSCQVRVTFSGSSVHIAKAPKKGDGLLACMQFYSQAANIRMQEPFLLKFGKMVGGTAGNIICGQADLEGSLRTRHPQTQEKIKQLLKKICAQTAIAAGCKGEVRFSQGYFTVCNDPVLWRERQKKTPVSKLNEVFWTADDFSYYQREIPGIYYFLGVGNTPPLHSPQFAFDEKILINGADFFHKICKTL